MDIWLKPRRVIPAIIRSIPRYSDGLSFSFISFTEPRASRINPEAIKPGTRAGPMMLTAETNKSIPSAT